MGVRTRNRVLVVDDSPTVLRLVQAALEADDFDVVTAEDGLEGLERVARDGPDLVVTDALMPRMDGFGLLKALRAQATTRHIPVIMLSSVETAEGEAEAHELAADDYIPKSLGPEQLLQRIRSAASRLRRSR